MKDELQVLWLRPLRKLSSLMLSENPCSEGNSVYRHTGCSDLPSADTETQTNRLQTHRHRQTSWQTLFGFDNSSSYLQCSGHSRNWRSWTMWRWFGNKQNLFPKIQLYPSQVFHQYHVVVQLHKSESQLEGTTFVIGDGWRDGNGNAPRAELGRGGGACWTGRLSCGWGRWRAASAPAARHRPQPPAEQDLYAGWRLAAKLIPWRTGIVLNIYFTRTSAIQFNINDSIMVYHLPMVQLSNEAYQHQQQSYSGGRLSYYNDHQQVNKHHNWRD